MKKYNVNVNGTSYEVTIEEIDVSEVKQTAAPEEKKAAAPAAPAQASAPVSGDGEKVTSPMPGNILSVNVANGDTVKKGQVLMILEAMKMENEIMAPCDGTVASLSVAKGATVESGALLCVIR